jgi:hypothetical protein
MRAQREEMRAQREEMQVHREVLKQVVQRLDRLTDRFDSFSQEVIRSRTLDAERFLSQEARIQRLEERVFQRP